MLILTRRKGERVMIGKDVVIEVTALGGNDVKLGISAPKEVIILREEIIGREVKKKEEKVIPIKIKKRKIDKLLDDLPSVQA